MVLYFTDLALSFGIMGKHLLVREGVLTVLSSERKYRVAKAGVFLLVAFLSCSLCGGWL